jgi:hypothetical protein
MQVQNGAILCGHRPTHEGGTYQVRSRPNAIPVNAPFTSATTPTLREERLGQLLGEVIKPIEIPPEIAEYIANGIQSADRDAERHRTQALEHLEQRPRVVVAKLDRGLRGLC